MKEDEWFAIADKIEKIVPIWWLIDPLEDHGIPSLPLLVGVLIILASLVAFLLIPAPKALLTIDVQSAGEALQAGITLSGDGYKDAGRTFQGTATFKVPVGKEVEIVVKSTGCEDAIETLRMLDDYRLTVFMKC